MQKFEDLSEEWQDRIDAWLDGTIEPEEFALLEEEMLKSADLRRIVRRYQGLNYTLQSVSTETEEATGPWLETVEKPKPKRTRSFYTPIAMAAGLAFLFGLGIMYFSRPAPGKNEALAAKTEQSASGFAVVGRILDPVWPEGSREISEGDMLSAETFSLQSGTAEIQFFSGATMTVEGPAEIAVKSGWEAICREGLVHMQVPPAARGFKLLAPSAEIIDLGTEFGLEVRDGREHVEVFDGEILLRQDGSDAIPVKTGGAYDLAFAEGMKEKTSGEIKIPDASRFEETSTHRQQSDFENWQSHRDQLAGDERLIAYYTFDRETPGSRIPNLAKPRRPDTDGTVILAEPVAGRWPDLKEALEFRRPGSRMRMNLPGEFSAFSFVCWVRIDSLDRQYNALFMGDGYENGEPHWQIREDGQMMLSVMIDDSRPNPQWPKSGDRFHRVYYSPSIWDLSRSGEWMHLASVFDPVNKSVSHYVNGKQISSQEIEPLYEVKEFRIGNAEVGNWGLPFRSDPNFAIRNLNGRMDEIAIFDAALDKEEVADLYSRSRAGRR